MSFRRAIKFDQYSILFCGILLFYNASAQEAEQDSLLQDATLDNVVQYALVHQPGVQQALTDEEITNKVIKGKLADWYPQINFTYNYQHYTDLQSSVIGGNV
ncbi:MAG TPA: TolC family protein, partial [Chryseolinea sp.]